MTVYLMRHSEPRWDLVASLGLKGWGVDLIPLSERGILETKKSISNLRQADIRLIVSSPMTRCLQTASIVGFGLNREVCVAFSLHEWIPDLSFSWGSYDEVQALEASMLSAGGEWSRDGDEKWEPLSRVRSRALAEIDAYKDKGPLLVMTHGMVIHAITGKRLKYSEIIKLQA